MRALAYLHHRAATSSSSTPTTASASASASTSTSAETTVLFVATYLPPGASRDANVSTLHRNATPSVHLLLQHARHSSASDAFVGNSLSTLTSSSSSSASAATASAAAVRTRAPSDGVALRDVIAPYHVCAAAHTPVVALLRRPTIGQVRAVNVSAAHAALEAALALHLAVARVRPPSSSSRACLIRCRLQSPSSMRLLLVAPRPALRQLLTWHVRDAGVGPSVASRATPAECRRRSRRARRQYAANQRAL